MPQRVATKRVESEAAQGDDSYVVLRVRTIAEAKQYRKRIADAKKAKREIDDMATLEKVIKEHVVDWNWVDEEGKPLPLPKDDPSVIDGLTDPEIEFLSGEIFGRPAELKN